MFTHEGTNLVTGLGRIETLRSSYPARIQANTLTEEDPTPPRATARRAATRRRTTEDTVTADATLHSNGHHEEPIPANLGAPALPAAAEEVRPRRRTFRPRAEAPSEAPEIVVPAVNGTHEDAAEMPMARNEGVETRAARPEAESAVEGADGAGRAGGDEAREGGEGHRERERWGRRDRRDRDRGQRPQNQENQQQQQQPQQQQGRRDRDRDRGFGNRREFRRNNFESLEESLERDYERQQAQSNVPALNVAELQAMTQEQIAEVAAQLELQDVTHLRRPDLIFRILQAQAEARGNIFSGGFLEVSDDGNYGFLRGERMLPGPHDIYVAQGQLRRYGLRPGDYVTGQVRQPRDNEKYYGLLKVEAVNGQDPEEAKKRPHFETLTAIFPIEQLRLETTAENLTHRIIDLIAPIGKGSRGLIVSPPKAGKTMLLKNIANGITQNHPDVHLIVLLIGERPEEVTDMRRTVRGEVVSSTFDEPVEDQTRVSEMALERAKRLVESGKDVVILMDSITRLTRAYNVALPSSGRTLSGGVDPIALYPPKRLFGAARKCDEGGSLTILATCLVDTGSRMDEVVFEEFKGTGNLELRLDRKLSERRFFPAIDIQASSTRREELLLDERTLKGVYLVRRMTAMISQNSPNQLEATERLLERMARTSSNDEFLASLKTDL
jgi:transcription termination factor Rho